LRVAGDLRKEGFPDFRMAVNISATQLGNPQFLPDLDDALTGADIDPSYLELEITESVAVIGTSDVIRLFNEIRSRNISLAIDDFGTGYSSLASIDRWPIDRLKIDKAFIQNLGKGNEGGRIVDMVVPLAKQLSLTTLAEGVETEDQLEILFKLGCDEVQGFLLGKPMDLPSLKEWLKKRG
jgi:EAL domain-containing protein (putative c-di-GMP-specific phosphodiesterase class I)